MSRYGSTESNQLHTLLDQTIDLLRQEKEDGHTGLELDPATVQALGQAVRQTTPKAGTAQTAGCGSGTLPTERPTSRDPVVRKPVHPAAAAVPVTANTAPLPDSLEELAQRIASCRQCPLHQWRKTAVPGAGCAAPDILFIGEGPGRDEDIQGIPFVGRAGELLTRLIIKMGYTRDTVFIGNIVKCRPTVDNEGMRDRPPTPEEMDGCLPYLKKQIALLRPKVIVLLGNTALQGLFGCKGITKYRGKWLVYEGIDTMPTYHPSYLLRNGGGNSKPFWEVWEDMTAVLNKLGKEAPRPGRVKPAQQQLL